MLKDIDFVIWKEGKYFVSKCLNVNISSFGDSIDEAALNLKEAVELYFEDEETELQEIEQIIIGREKVNV